MSHHGVDKIPSTPHGIPIGTASSMIQALLFSHPNTNFVGNHQVGTDVTTVVCHDPGLKDIDELNHWAIPVLQHMARILNARRKDPVQIANFRQARQDGHVAVARLTYREPIGSRTVTETTRYLPGASPAIAKPEPVTRRTTIITQTTRALLFPSFPSLRHSITAKPHLPGGHILNALAPLRPDDSNHDIDPAKFYTLPDMFNSPRP